jgi:excisionase family DNA binding protein
MNTQPLSTTQELADYFQVSTRTIHNWVSSNSIPSIRIGAKSIRFDFEAVREHVGQGS